MGISRAMLLYYYTDSAGIKDILDSGFIQYSAIGDGKECVTLSGKGPDRYTKTQIVKNNWDDGFNRATVSVKEGHIHYAFQINIPESEVSKVKTKQDVYIYADNISLKKYHWEVFELI